jgi:enterochelin esterase-like enzyme
MSAQGSPWWDVSLTAWWSVTFLVVVAIGVTTLTALTWDARRFKRTRRAILLILTQVFTMVTLGVVVNSFGGFYGNLGDLIGHDAKGGAVIDAGPGANPGTPQRVPEWLAAARKVSGTGRGVWAQMTISGRATGYSLPAWVYVPDAYFDANRPDQTFPVFMLLAGFPGRVENWDSQGGMVAILDQLIDAGKIPPMIFISVSQNRDATHDSECVDAVGGFRADTYITQDATEAIRSTFRVDTDRTSWALMGYSTGGYCAVDLALRHPTQFAAAVSLDGYFAPAIDNTTGDLFKKNTTLQHSYTPSITIKEKRAVPLRFYLMGGDSEPAAKAAGVAFAKSVKEPDTATLVDLPGGHNWNTWRAALPGALEWFVAGLPRATPTGG